ncbi:MAG: DNA gyrase subunit A [Acidimicrobiales bacterium]|jgi:DNA gyrase subunit A|nr:DNA gyrase subunit A [Acidimicrobiales bacterium]MDP6322752.1 DNA gyrase subunit A [Acidimicrobiales bacterium]HJM97358.1 DNA gyrase subunit A [Acidimicrobiales bacterium]
MSDTDISPPEERNDGVEDVEIQQEMEQSFLDYAMSVIVARALPDARDGLKPVHRRILWGMYDTNVRPDRSHVKCATVVGEVMGHYHPHGDSAIYEALVRMGQIWSLRYPLIDPHGNFGSPNDGAAAMRYTESRLSELAMRMMEGIDEETVDFLDNFDGSSQEPKVLPARFPNLLVNGGQGIAVGMATNIPPHNLREVADAAIHLINNPEATIKELMEYIKGPDFPTGGEILGHSGIHQAYMTGKGSIKVRAKAEIVEGGKYDQIVITEIPYQTSVETIEEKAADLVDRKALDGIRLIRNESAKGKTRLVFELKKDAPALVILNQLYKGTPLQTSFSVNMVALDDGVPRTMTLLDALTCWVNHQIEIVTRRTEYRLEKAEHELHINTGLLKAIGMIDEIIATIRASEDRATARESLMAEPFEFSELQTNHILDMQLGRLTRLGRDQIEEKVAELTESILELQKILADDKILRNIIIDELSEIRDEFSNDRRTELVVDPGDFLIEDLIEDEDLVFSLSAGGYVKTVSSDEFRSQGRGGRGVAGAALKDEDLITTILHTSAHAYLLFFTNLGKVYRLKTHQIPTMGRTARGTAIVNLLQLSSDEKVAAVIDTRDYETNRFLVFATKRGQVKKTKFTEYDKSRSKGLIAINLKDGDELVRVVPTTGEDDICLVSSNGKVMRFHEKEARPMGRSAGGVRGIKLKSEDEVVAVSIAREAKTLLIVTDKGFGKRTEMENFNPKHRAGQGVTGIKLSEDRGKVVASRAVGDDDEVFMISSNGVIIRMKVDSISVQGRSATGVKLMAVEEGVQVTAIAPVIQAEELEETTSDL